MKCFWRIRNIFIICGHLSTSCSYSSKLLQLSCPIFPKCTPVFKVNLRVLQFSYTMIWYSEYNPSKSTLTRLLILNQSLHENAYLLSLKEMKWRDFSAGICNRWGFSISYYQIKLNKKKKEVAESLRIQTTILKIARLVNQVSRW